jgi:predicted homoserine dehydrogenase-like protein
MAQGLARLLVQTGTRPGYPEFRVAAVLTRRNFAAVHDMRDARAVLTNDPEQFFAAGLDCVVEMNGDAIYAAPLVERTLKAGIPVVTTDCELQLVAGSALREFGTLVEAEGDQPGSLAALSQNIRAMGFAPLVYGNVKKFLNPNPSRENMEFWAKKQGISLHQVTAFTDGTKVQIEQAVVANGLRATIARRGLLGVPCERLADGAHTLADAAKALGMPIADYVLTADAPGAVFIVAEAPEGHRKALEYFKMGSGPYYLFTRPFHVGYFEVRKAISDVLERPGYFTFSNSSQPTVQVVAVPKRNIAAGDRVERAMGSFDFRGEAVRIADVPEGVPIALLANARFARGVQAGDTVTFADVELPSSRALELYQKMLDNRASLQPAESE